MDDPNMGSDAAARLRLVAGSVEDWLAEWPFLRCFGTCTLRWRTVDSGPRTALTASARHRRWGPVRTSSRCISPSRRAIRKSLGGNGRVAWFRWLTGGQYRRLRLIHCASIPCSQVRPGQCRYGSSDCRNPPSHSELAGGLSRGLARFRTDARIGTLRITRVNRNGPPCGMQEENLFERRSCILFYGPIQVAGGDASLHRPYIQRGWR